MASEPAGGKPPDAPATAPTVRLASTVVLARPGPSGVELFMVRRSQKSSFYPNAVVFPGGRLEPSDGTGDAAFERAARRECLEESGIDLGGDLLWFDTWITPSAQPRRYDTRFFLARFGSGEGAHAQADGHETHDGRWSTVRSLLEAWEQDTLDLPPPTLATLLRLDRLPFEALASLGEHDPRPPILPKGLAHDQSIFVLLPHDPDYDETPGQGAPAPDRALDLPSRFRRTERRWLPCEP